VDTPAAGLGAGVVLHERAMLGSKELHSSPGREKYHFFSMKSMGKNLFLWEKSGS